MKKFSLIALVLISALAVGLAVSATLASCGEEGGGFPGGGGGDGGQTITVPGNTLQAKLDWLAWNTRPEDEKTYIIEVSADETIRGQGFGFSPAPPVGVIFNNRTIILRGRGGARTISGDGSGDVFYVGKGVTLILDNNITLLGREVGTTVPAYIVSVSDGGTLVMNGGSRITGHFGNGVYVGVRGGTFTMNGGEISGNRDSGVYVLDGGTFRIVTGTIYGSDAPENLRNTPNALSGYAEYGTFNGTTWNRAGSLNTTDSTIRVVNGALR